MTNEEPLRLLAWTAAKVKAEAEAVIQFVGTNDIPSDVKIHVSLCRFAADLILAFPRPASKEPECYFLITQNINSEGWPEEVVEVAWPLVDCYRGVIVGWKQFSSDIKLQDKQTINEDGRANLEKLFVQLVADMTDWLDALLPSAAITASEPKSDRSGEIGNQKVLAIDGKVNAFVEETNAAGQKSYLGIEVSLDRKLTYQGKTCDFKKAFTAYDLTMILYSFGNQGARVEQVFDLLYNEKPRTPDALRKQKNDANEILASVGLEIDVPRGKNHMTLKPIRER